MADAASRDGRTRQNGQHILGFRAAWIGWTLDGMDSFIYVLVLSPALAGAVSAMGTLGTPVALTAIAFGASLPIVPFATETRGQALPALSTPPKRRAKVA